MFSVFGRVCCIRKGQCNGNECKEGYDTKSYQNPPVTQLCSLDQVQGRIVVATLIPLFILEMISHLIIIGGF